MHSRRSLVVREGQELADLPRTQNCQAVIP